MNNGRDRLANGVMWDIAVITVVLAVLLFAALVMADDTEVAAVTSVRLHDSVRVAGPKVLLRDVAELSGRDAQRIGEIAVATLGPSARTVTVTRESVQQLLSEAGVHWGRLSLSGFTRCEVSHADTGHASASVASTPGALSNPDTEISLDSAVTLRERVIQFIEAAAGQPRNELQITFNSRDEDVLNRGALHERYEIEPVVSGMRSRVPIVVRRYEGDRIAETLTLHVDVARRYLAAVAVRNVGRGQTLTPDDVEIREVYLDGGAEPVTELSQAIGQSAATAIEAGTVLSVRDLRSPTLVRRGDLVTVRCFVGGLVIKTVGRAASDGAMGEWISVRNERSKETFVAKVTGFREAVAERSGAEEDRT